MACHIGHECPVLCTPGLSAVETHFVIDRKALASKTLFATMKDRLAIAIRVVNFIKASAVNT